MKTTSRIATTLLLALAVGAWLQGAAWAGGSGWTENYDQALAQAKKEKKMVLLDFTGSDWCGWCIKLDQEVFATEAFRRYAAENLILVKLDYPRRKTQSTEIKKQNILLMKQYGVRGFPTCFVLNSEGKQIGQMGYQPGGPEAFIAELNKLKGR